MENIAEFLSLPEPQIKPSNIGYITPDQKWLIPPVHEGQRVVITYKRGNDERPITCPTFTEAIHDTQAGLLVLHGNYFGGTVKEREILCTSVETRLAEYTS